MSCTVAHPAPAASRPKLSLQTSLPAVARSRPHGNASSNPSRLRLAVPTPLQTSSPTTLNTLTNGLRGQPVAKNSPSGQSLNEPHEMQTSVSSNIPRRLFTPSPRQSPACARAPIFCQSATCPHGTSPVSPWVLHASTSRGSRAASPRPTHALRRAWTEHLPSSASRSMTYILPSGAKSILRNGPRTALSRARSLTPRPAQRRLKHVTFQECLFQLIPPSATQDQLDQTEICNAEACQNDDTEGQAESQKDECEPTDELDNEGLAPGIASEQMQMMDSEEPLPLRSRTAARGRRDWVWTLDSDED